MNRMIAATGGRPPLFDQATRLRQQARAAGLDPNYWYPVAEVRAMAKGSVEEVVFWHHSIALYRAEDGSFHAVENRCRHRQLKLSLGQVKGCRLVCAYHGWEYDPDGKLAAIPHDLFQRNLPDLGLRTYPTQVRYGLVWIFPGDPDRSKERHIPSIPELAGPKPWACVPIVNTWTTHHSMVIDNVSDFTHEHLHRFYRPFKGAVLTRCETLQDNVHVEYDTQIGGGGITGRFIERDSVDTSRIELCYQYPYQWSNTDGAIKHWLFVQPIDERTTRCFFLFYFKSFKIPGLPIRIPQIAMKTVLKIANRFSIGPLLDQDRFAVEAEQEGYENHWDAQPVELNPAVAAFQRVTVRKWRDYLAEQTTDRDENT